MMYRVLAVMLTCLTVSRGHKMRYLEEVHLKIKNGEIIGQRVLTDEDKTIDQYLSIPYAEPPLGELRFRRTVPATPWGEPRNVSSYPRACLQAQTPTSPGVLDDELKSEDCLYVSVYTPVKREGLLPVLVWIHGGGFVEGRISEPSDVPGNIVGSYGIITVGIQYRLGSMGFFYMGEDQAPGNVALLDQQTALKWVKDNIVMFGGNPDSITIMGESAGSGSVNYHMLSPKSKGLFHRAITMSGAAISTWAYMEPELLKSKGRELLSALSCERDSVTEAMDCMRSLEGMDIIRAERKLPAIMGSRFTPTVDHHFINHPPRYILDNNLFHDVPVMGGVTHDEGDFFLPMFAPELVQPTPPNVTDQDFQEIFRGVGANASSEEISQILKFYRHYLSEEKGMEVTNFGVLRALIGDSAITCDTIYTLKKYADRRPDQIYMYVLNYKVGAAGGPTWKGVAHALDLPLIFGHHQIPGKCLSTQDQVIRSRLMVYWTNFIKTGNPNKDASGKFVSDKWSPIGKDKKRVYLSLDIQDPWKHRHDFHKPLCEQDYGIEASAHSGTERYFGSLFWCLILSSILYCGLLCTSKHTLRQ